jgi:lipopolysaccharide/colanic/teichoic acid biosynthesis glycosyltransferase
LRPPRLSTSSAYIKRCVDVVGSLFGLIVLSPVFAAVAVAIKLDSGGPVFFRQVRMGTRDRTFRIWKFRTMSLDAEGRKADIAHLSKHAVNGFDTRMFKIPDDPRVTRVGRFLRRSSLDELPQLINVLVGEMSLVGPRPLILDEHKFVKDWALKRVDLQPGITGLWQVLGRSDIPFDEMITLDYRYVSNWSLASDLKLLIHTVPTVLRSRNT